MKLILSDLDNTLLRSDKSISAHTVQILESCRSKGFLLGFATARAESAMTRFIDAVKPDLIISNGGAAVKIGKQVVFR